MVGLPNRAIVHVFGSMICVVRYCLGKANKWPGLCPFFAIFVNLA